MKTLPKYWTLIFVYSVPPAAAALTVRADPALVTLARRRGVQLHQAVGATLVATVPRGRGGSGRAGARQLLRNRHRATLSPPPTALVGHTHKAKPFPG